MKTEIFNKHSIVAALLAIFVAITAMIGIPVRFILAAPPQRLEIPLGKDISVLKLEAAKPVKARVNTATLKPPAITAQEWKEPSH